MYGMLRTVLSHMIKIGDLTVTDSDGSASQYGDKTGQPVHIRFNQVVFVTLGNDGTTLSVAPPTGENALFESLGRNYAAVMKSLSPKDNTNGS